MKFIKNLLIISNIILLTQSISYGQVTNTPNNGAVGNYVGWDNSMNSSLDIMHQINYPLNFYTQGTRFGAAGPPWDNLRMTIYEDPADQDAFNQGFVGIGYTPPPRHLTIATLGSCPTCPLSMFGNIPSMVELLVAGGNGRNDTVQEVAEFRSTNGTSSSIGIRIRGSRGANQNSDCSHVNFDNYYLRDDGTTDEFALGRVSADVRNFDSDLAGGYVRIKTGDRMATATGGYNTALFADQNGQVGIGLLFNYTGSIFPSNRLEVYDPNIGQAQFRITQDYNRMFSTFQTTDIGDLLINTQWQNADGDDEEKFVGINCSYALPPLNTLEINSTALSPEPSGLRFRNLTSGSTPASANGLVLTVDNDGDVILVDDQGGTGTVTSCNGAGGTANYITKFTSANDICISSIWEDPTSLNVGIGTITPQYKLSNNGTAMFANVPLTAALTQYNTSMQYPLAIKSNTALSSHPAGLALFSSGTYAGGKDELNIFVDDIGTSVYETKDYLVDFRTKTQSVSYLGFDPDYGSVVVKDDFTGAPAYPTGFRSKMYVEAQDPGPGPSHNYAIWANNTNTTYGGGASVAGIRAQATTTRTTPADASNQGIYALAEGAILVNHAVDGRAIYTGGGTTPAIYRGGFFIAQNGFENIGVYGEGSGVQDDSYGGRFLANGTKINYGVNGETNQGTENYGGNFSGTGTGATTINYGVLGHAQNGGTNYGVKGTTGGTASSTSANYAIYGVTTQNTTACISSGCTQAAGYFDGDLFYTMGAFIPSDSTLKTNIVPSTNNSQLLQQINTYTYQFDTNKTKGMNAPVGMQIGLISQEVKSILPNLVKDAVHPETRDSLGNIVYPSINYKALNMTGMVPLLIGGHKEQQTLIDSLTARLANLEAIVNNCCGILPRGNNDSKHEGALKNIELNNITTIFLDQNRPNPFSEQTDINYFLPEEVQDAQMLFYDQAGILIKTVKLNDRNKGTIHVYSPELKNGSYTYSLIADGKIIETKTMIKMK